MHRAILSLALAFPLVCPAAPTYLCAGEAQDAESLDQLPQPNYHRQPSDPAWLASVVQFHGHLGPAVVAGARMGMIGLRAVEAKGYFDVEVTCEGPLAKPPQACFLDGVQVATGATMGKRTLQWVQAEQIVVRIKNTRTGKTVDLRPTPALMELLASFKSQPKAGADHGAKPDDEQLEAVARKIAVMAEKEVANVVTADGKPAK
jgi:formylmethanofuran dehydrogenase subunit E